MPVVEDSPLVGFLALIQLAVEARRQPSLHSSPRLGHWVRPASRWGCCKGPAIVFLTRLGPAALPQCIVACLSSSPATIASVASTSPMIVSWFVPCCLEFLPPDCYPGYAQVQWRQLSHAVADPLVASRGSSQRFKLLDFCLGELQLLATDVPGRVACTPHLAPC